jgi:hypothetical protein
MLKLHLKQSTEGHIVGRPITKNVSSIIEDTKKLNSQYGIIALRVLTYSRINSWS